ncbi:contact-dependent growth inhibition system immunity protein [Acetobacter sp. DsW_063]
MKHQDKRIRAPLSASDEELGKAIRKAFSRCEAPGRPKINWSKPE